MRKFLQVLICSLLVFAVADTSFAFLWWGGGGGKSKKSTAAVTTSAQPGNRPTAGQSNTFAKSVEVNVPEPATIILMTTGMGLLGLFGRKGMKKSRA